MLTSVECLLWWGCQPVLMIAKFGKHQISNLWQENESEASVDQFLQGIRTARLIR